MAVLLNALVGLVVMLAAWPGAAWAHVTGFTDTSIQISATGVRLIYTVPTDNLLELDVQSSGQGGPQSIQGGAGREPEAYLRQVREGFSLISAGQRCLYTQGSARRLDSVPSTQFQLTYVCPEGLDELTLGYHLFFARWPDHENFARVFMAGQRMRMRFTAEQPETTIPVAKLLHSWSRPLSVGFFDADPHRVNAGVNLGAGADGANAGVAREAALPKIVEPAPSLGPIDFAMIDPGFIRLGLSHIYAGLDHVLFVVGLVLLTRSWRLLLVLVTAFTLAHTLTLALATLGMLDLDPRWTEILIAGTIVYIGVENLWALRRPPVADAPLWTGATVRRAALVFAFGLIHGVGFSDVLRQMGLREDLLGSLVYFNAGVEIGQLMIIALSLPLVLLWRRQAWGRQMSMGVSASVAMAGAAMMWGRL